MTAGITRYVLAVPGLDPGIGPGRPDKVKHSVLRIGVTGMRPVMTWRVPEG